MNVKDDELIKKVKDLEKRIKDLESDVYSFDNYIPAHTLISRAIKFIEEIKSVGPEDLQQKFKINNYRAESLIKILSDYGYLSKEKDEKGRRTIILKEPERVILTGEKDLLLPKAIKIIQEYERASASLLQRRLTIGYARAARLLDQLESEGVIGPAEGSKPREVLKK